jgi:hypothetical protein
MLNSNDISFVVNKDLELRPRVTFRVNFVLGAEEN